MSTFARNTKNSNKLKIIWHGGWMGKSGKMGNNVWTNFLKQRGNKACLENKNLKWKYTCTTQCKKW